MSEHDQGKNQDNQPEEPEKPGQGEQGSWPPPPPPPPEGGDQSWLDDAAPSLPAKEKPIPPAPPSRPPQAPPAQPQAPPITPPIAPLERPSAAPTPQDAEGSAPPPLPPLERPTEAPPAPAQKPQFGGPVFPQPGGPPRPTTQTGVPIAGYAGPEVASTVDTLPDADEQQAEVAEAKFTRPFSFKPAGHKGSVTPDLKGRGFRVGVLALVVVVALVGLITIWPKAATQSESAGLQWQVGQLARYRVSMAMTGHVSSPALKGPAEASAHVDAVVNLKVGAVGSDGTATMEVVTSGFQISTNPPTAVENIPETVRTHIQIGADGRTASGDFGLSQLGLSSEISPGLVQFAPLLPSGKISAGASWTDSTDLQLSSGQTLHATEKNTLLGFTSANGIDVAVVSSKISIPTIDLTYPVSDFASFASKSPKVQAEVAASDGTMKVTGSSELSMTSQIATATGQLIATHNAGTITLALAPETASNPPVPAMNFTGSDSLTIQQVTIKAKPVGTPSA